MNNVRPRIQVLTPEQIADIHNYALTILSSSGIRVESERARKILSKAIGKPARDKVVSIPSDLVEWAIQAAPAEVDIYDRRREPAFKLGGRPPQPTRFGIGVTTLYCQDPASNRILPFSRQFMQSMTRLGTALNSFDAVSTIGVLQDTPPEISDLYGTLDMAANTFKPLVILISEAKCFGPVLDLLEHLHGDLASQPFVIPYFNPITPLILNNETCEKMFLTIERGLPFMFSNYSMSGATSPITPAGTLALLTAELLAGLVLSQLVKEGTPVILGSLPATFEMKSGINMYTPHSFVQNLACAELMAHYGVPHCGTSGSGYGWGADLMSGGMNWMSHLTSCAGKVGLSPFVGDNFGSLVFSPALIVYADEVIRQARLFAEGFALSDETVRLDEIKKIGPGGNFLTSQQTLELFRRTDHSSKIWPNPILDKWQAMGSPKAEDMLQQYTRELMENLPVPEDHAELIERGEAFIDDL
jgi:trimethylamine--corrinoid protein Co-methyltransferase